MHYYYYYLGLRIGNSYSQTRDMTYPCSVIDVVLLCRKSLKNLVIPGKVDSKRLSGHCLICMLA